MLQFENIVANKWMVRIHSKICLTKKYSDQKSNESYQQILRLNVTMTDSNNMMHVIECTTNLQTKNPQK